MLNSTLIKKKKKTNILYFEPSTGYGGSSRCLLEWLRNINSEKYNPLVVTYFDGPAIKEIKELGVETIKLPYFSFVKRLSLKYENLRIISYFILLLDLINIIPVFFHLILLIKRRNIDFLHINSGVTIGLPAILATKFCRKKCICHIHGTWNIIRRERVFGKLVDKFIVLTTNNFDKYVPIFGLGKVSLIYNGIELTQSNSPITDYLKKEFGINATGHLVGMVGRITKGKGHEDFLKAAQIINTKKNNVTFLIIGSSVFFEKEYEIYIRKLASDYHLDNRLIFTGWRNDVKNLLSFLDILIFPSTTFPEGFPLACVEAMALGKPIVATNIPGPSEIVLDNITGFLIPPRRPDILTEKVIRLIEDRELAKFMGAQAKKRAEESFNIKGIIKQIERAYDDIIFRKENVYAL